MLDIFTLTLKKEKKSKEVSAEEIFARDFIEAFNSRKADILSDLFVSLSWERSKQPRFQVSKSSTF